MRRLEYKWLVSIVVALFMRVPKLEPQVEAGGAAGKQTESGAVAVGVH